MTDRQTQPERVILGIVTGAAAITLGLGVWMRFWLAGAPAAKSDLVFAHVRHAHSHLGYYGLLFPLSWAALALAGDRRPSARTLMGYGGAVAIAITGFLAGGYTALSIAGSTAVGAIWLHVAFLNRKNARLWRSWRALPPLGVLFGTLLIPPIGVLTPRDPALAAQLVRVFLTLILLNVFVPAALVRTRPPIAPLWMAASLTAAMASAFPELGGLSWAWVLLAVGIARSAAELPQLLRTLWTGLALSFLAMPSPLLRHDSAVAIAGLHFIVLGPLLVTFAWHRLSAVKPGLLAAYLLAVGIMCAAILAQMPSLTGRFPLALTASVAAWSGAAIFALGAAMALSAARAHSVSGTSSL